MLSQEVKLLSVENHFVLDQKVGQAKEVKQLEKDGNAKGTIKMGTIPNVPVTKKGDLKRGPLFIFNCFYLTALTKTFT